MWGAGAAKLLVASVAMIVTPAKYMGDREHMRLEHNNIMTVTNSKHSHI